jgi:hypothetical protein
MADEEWVWMTHTSQDKGDAPVRVTKTAFDVWSQLDPPWKEAKPADAAQSALAEIRVTPDAGPTPARSESSGKGA